MEPSVLLLISAFGAAKYPPRRSGVQTSTKTSFCPRTGTRLPPSNARGCFCREPRETVSGCGQATGGPVTRPAQWRVLAELFFCSRNPHARSGLFRGLHLGRIGSCDQLDRTENPGRSIDPFVASFASGQ